MTDSATHRTISTIYRIESPRLIAALTRFVHDVGVAEELAQDALVAALQQWPEQGLPDNPGAWLMTAAKRRAINAWKRNELVDRKHVELGRELRDEAPEIDLDDPVGDDLLRLVFIACHPVLSMDARVALTLRLLGGLTTHEIARAFFSTESTVAQRIVRAKRTLSEAKVPFEVPRGDALAERLAAVLGVIYLVFNEGYSATAGDDWMRTELCDEALRLGRTLASLMPDEPEVHGLIALMELHASRAAARVGASGEPILLSDQNRGRWDALLIQRGLAALARAESLATTRGPYALQAAIAACHARASAIEETDWRAIADLYRELALVAPSPVVELNRAVAVGMAEGPEAGLAIVDTLANDETLSRYHRLPSVRGDLLFKLGRLAEARAEFERAAALAENTRERAFLLARATEH